ncbi:MAG TPA: hypothetical protein P5514_11025 [Bacteroidales bacterium]|nr:hypothetical protein [Bacteroidales bacterium]HRX97469.1 hypothetical protein [Bacteroidales bacterium]
MKNKIVFLLVLLLFSGIANNAENRSATIDKTPSLKLMATPQSGDMLNDLVKAYQNTGHGSINIDYQTEVTDNAIGIATASELSTLPANLDWHMLIGREIIVPVMSLANDDAGELIKVGLTREYLANIALGNIENSNLSLVFPQDKTLRGMVIDYLEIDPSELKQVQLASANEVQALLCEHPSYILFCRLSDITIPEQQSLKEGLQLIPIDKNGNGKLDYHESIYTDVNEFMRGVWIGKYPHKLVQNIYAFSAQQPVDPAALGFIQWLLGDGQHLLTNYGYNELMQSERLAKLEILKPAVVVEPAPSTGFAMVKVVFIAFVLLAVLFFILNITTFRKSGAKSLREHLNEEHHMIHAKNIDLPKGLYYDKSHTWAYMNESGFVKIGLDDFIQHVTGPYTKIQMKEPGTKIKRNDLLVTIIQDGKQLQLYTPISGKIIEINEDLVAEPTSMNCSPYVEGWVYKIEPTNWLREIQFMRMADKYREWLENEFTRLKEFLTAPKGNYNPNSVPVIFQEGGALKDNILRDMGPEVWEDFQKHFVDVSSLS